MATLMRNTQPHWAGNTFVPLGMILAEGDPQANPKFFEPYEVELPATHDDLVEQAEALGVRVDKRWGDERLRSEIVLASAPTDDEPEPPSGAKSSS